MGIKIMSRIGKLPIKITNGLTINYESPNLRIKGKYGELSKIIPESINIEQKDDLLIIVPKIKNRTTAALHGLYRSLIYNMVIGVTEQFKTILILQGVGYRGIVQNQKLILNLGYSHQIELEIPNNIKVEIVKNTTINLIGCDKEDLGLFASKIRSWRPPEPYKGKGILYDGEIVKRKAGKSGKK